MRDKNIVYNKEEENEKISKFIAILLVFTLSISIITTNFVSLISVHAIENINERTEEESIDDTKRKFPFIAGDWDKASKSGIIPPYGYFHYEVQNYIINKKKIGILHVRNIILNFYLVVLLPVIKLIMDELIYITVIMTLKQLISGK